MSQPKETTGLSGPTTSNPTKIGSRRARHGMELLQHQAGNRAVAGLIGGHRVPPRWQFGVNPGRPVPGPGMGGTGPMGGTGQRDAMGGVLSSLMTLRHMESETLRGAGGMGGHAMTAGDLSTRRSLMMQLLDMLEVQMTMGAVGMGARGMGGRGMGGAGMGLGAMAGMGIGLGAMAGAGMGLGAKGSAGLTPTPPKTAEELEKEKEELARKTEVANRAKGEKLADGPVRQALDQYLDPKGGESSWKYFTGKLSGDRPNAATRSLRESITDYVTEGKFAGKVADRKVGAAVRDIIGQVAQDHGLLATMKMVSATDAGDMVAGKVGDVLPKLGEHFKN